MSWKNKKVLVTGGAGVIGRSLIQQLAASGSEILCIDREEKPFDLPDRIEYCHEDISEMDLKVILQFDPEFIFHLAASFERTEETPEFWDINFRDNVTTSHRIIGITRELKHLKKFIFASSYLIYSSSLYLFDRPQKKPYLLKESDRFSTRNVTGAAKYYAEQELDFMRTTHGKFISLAARIFRVYGCGSRDVISRWVRAALNKEELKVYRKENLFDYIFAGDVASGLIKMAEELKKDEIVNLGTGEAKRIEEVVAVIKFFFPNVKMKDINEGHDFEASSADMTKFKKFIGWQPATSLKEGIGKLVTYEKKVLDKAYA